MDTHQFLDIFVKNIKDVLTEQLVGIYLHGSLATTGFNPAVSDIDLLAAVRGKLTDEQVMRLVMKVLEMDDELPLAKGYEFSIVREDKLRPFQYPTPFEFHYSPMHRERYRHEKDYLCGGFEDEDLGSHFMAAYHRGKCLYGPPLQEICEPIPANHFLASIYHDIRNAEEDAKQEPVYILLNLCRVLNYVREGSLASKQEGGEWAIRELPLPYRDLIASCLERYAGDSLDYKPDPDKLDRTVAYLLGEIRPFVKAKLG